MVINSNKRDFKANKLKIGTRGSPLALAQALEVKKEIIKHHELNDEAMQKLRRRYFNTKRTTNHWPYPMNAIPKQPNTYNYYFNDNIEIDYNKLPIPILDDLMEKIENLL